MRRTAILSEGLAGDLRPLCYGRSTWDVPFLGKPLLAHVFAWLERRACEHVVLLDDTPNQALIALAERCPVSLAVHAVDVPRGRLQRLGTLVKDLAPERLYHFKPCAMVEPEMESLEQFHVSSEGIATFALTRLDPGGLTWPLIPACRLDEQGCILEVTTLRRTDALGSASLDNVLGTSAPSRPREFWAPRNVSILEPALLRHIDPRELLAPLSGFARKLSADGHLCFGRALKGRWWPASSTPEVMAANREALRALGGDEEDSDCRVARDATLEADVQLTLSIVGADSRVGASASIAKSVLSERCQIGPSAVLHDVLLGPRTKLPDHVQLTNCVIGDGEVQNLTRGVPVGGWYVDGLRTVDEQAVLKYWHDHVPLEGRQVDAQILETLSRGLDNNVYRLFDGRQEYVVKRRLDCNAYPLLREYHVLRHLHEHGACGSPRPLLVDLRPEIRVAPCLVMSYVEGKAIPLGGITPEIATAIGVTCREVHSVPVRNLLRDMPELTEQSYPDLGTYVTELCAQYNTFLETRRVHDALGEKLHRLVKWMHAMAERENVHWTGYVPRVLCQGDLREFNMLTLASARGAPPTRIALLDWERCGIDDPAYDVGWFLALAQLSAESEAAFRESYGFGPAGDLTFWRRVEAFRTADVLTWPIHLLSLVDDCREKRTPAVDAEHLVASYEEDAYRALAVAFNAVGADGDNGHVDVMDADMVRQLGPLFA